MYVLTAPKRRHTSPATRRLPPNHGKGGAITAFVSVKLISLRSHAMFGASFEAPTIEGLFVDPDGGNVERYGLPGSLRTCAPRDS